MEPRERETRGTLGRRHWDNIVKEERELHLTYQSSCKLLSKICVWLLSDFGVRCFWIKSGNGSISEMPKFRSINYFRCGCYSYISLFLFFSGVPTNESPESKTCSSAKVSGLQRSQEQSNSEVPFTPPVPSPTPASAPTGSPAPAAAAAPLEPPRSRLPTPPPLSVKKEHHPPPPVPTPPLLRAPPHPQPHPPHPHSHQEPRILPPPQHHARPVISHQVHHPLYSSLHDIRWVVTRACLVTGAWMYKTV